MLAFIAIEPSVVLAPLKPAIAALLLAILWILETVAPMFPGRSRRAGHALANIALGVGNAVLMAAGFAVVMLLVTEWARKAEFGLLHWINAPVWVEWIMMLLVFDAWMYAWHRLNHRLPLLWRFHSVHHTDAELDASSALRFHTGEIFLSSLARLAVLPLLGMTLVDLVVYELILLPVILFHHSNVRLPAGLDRALRWLIVTPRMHWVHHSSWQPETDSNYASVLSIWDRLFGSFRLRSKPEEIDLGLGVEDTSQWRSLWGMLCWPFQRQVTHGSPPEDDGERRGG